MARRMRGQVGTSTLIERRPRTGRSGPRKGRPVLTAQKAGRCSWCNGPINIGSPIRSNGKGGWLHAEHRR